MTGKWRRCKRFSKSCAWSVVKGQLRRHLDSPSKMRWHDTSKLVADRPCTQRMMGPLSVILQTPVGLRPPQLTILLWGRRLGCCSRWLSSARTRRMKRTWKLLFRVCKRSQQQVCFCLQARRSILFCQRSIANTASESSGFKTPCNASKKRSS